LIDYHIHPDYSHDASDSVVDYCWCALNKGIEEICFTTHYDPDPVRANIERVVVKGVEQPMNYDWAGTYLQEINEARTQFPQLRIRAGIEIGYEMGLEGRIADFVSRNRFDFVLGAVHCLDHIAITSRSELNEFRMYLKTKGVDFIAQRYFDYVRAAAQSQLFDCIAHLDIWRKYILLEMGEEFDRAITKFVPLMIEAIVQAGVGLEINTASLRRGDNEPYPIRKIIAQAVEAGINTFTIGSDAHCAGDLGSGVQEAIRILKRFGLNPARFENRRKILT